MKLGSIDIPTEEIGDLWTLEGVVYGNGEQSVAMVLPYAPGSLGSKLPQNTVVKPAKVLETIFPTDEEWQTFLKQTDDPVTPIGKAFVRKATRQVIESVRWRVYKRDNYTCRYCGRDDVPMTVDHYIAQKYGGEWTFENLLTSCRNCQKLKGHKTIQEWEDYCAKHPGLKAF